MASSTRGVQALGKAERALGGRHLQNSIQKVRIKAVGLACVFLDMICRTPTGNHTGQLPANFAQALSGADCVRLAKLAFTPPAPKRTLRS